jgi:hypothetical protein
METRYFQKVVDEEKERKESPYGYPVGGYIYVQRTPLGLI